MDLDTARPFRGSEAVAAGQVTKGLLRGREFRRVEADTYVGARVADSPLLRVRAALVRGGPTAVATGWSACVVHGLDVASRPVPLEIAAPDRRLRPGPGLTVRRARVPEEEVTEVDGTRATTMLRTALDLAARSGPAWSAVDRVVDPLTDAVVAADALACRGGFTADDLRSAAACHGGCRRVRRVERVAALLDPRPDSPPESRARVALVLAGLPRPRVRHPVRDAHGVGRELDLAWPEFRVAVEYDGRDHALSDRRGRDIDRLDALRRAGWVVIVVTAVQVARPRWLADRVREELLARGWVPGPNPWGDVVAENEAWAYRVRPSGRSG